MRGFSIKKSRRDVKEDEGYGKFESFGAKESD
jgi:hypothetical protein